MWLAVVRDAAIVLLALETIVIGVLLGLMLLQIRKLVKLLREEIAPLLYSANETANTVQTTTAFVSDSVIEPLIKLRSYAAGSLEAARNLGWIRRQVRERAKASEAMEEDSAGQTLVQ